MSARRAGLGGWVDEAPGALGGGGSAQGEGPCGDLRGGYGEQRASQGEAVLAADGGVITAPATAASAFCGVAYWARNHWHGIAIRNNMDGVPMMTRAA